MGDRVLSPDQLYIGAFTLLATADMLVIAGLEKLGAWMVDDLRGWWSLPGALCLLLALGLLVASLAILVLIMWRLAHHV